MQKEEIITGVAYLVTYRWREEPVTMYADTEAKITGIEHWKDSDPKHYVMMHRFGSDRLSPIELSQITRKPLAGSPKCSHCESQYGGCAQCRPDILSY